MQRVCVVGHVGDAIYAKTAAKDKDIAASSAADGIVSSVAA
jgi:hypothetical protein